MDVAVVIFVEVVVVVVVDVVVFVVEVCVQANRRQGNPCGVQKLQEHFSNALSYFRKAPLLEEACCSRQAPKPCTTGAFCT